MLNKSQTGVLLDNMMRLRDPRAENPYSISSYCHGIIHGAMMAGQIDAATSTRLCALVNDASKHHYLKTPWPVVGDWFPF